MGGGGGGNLEGKRRVRTPIGAKSVAFSHQVRRRAWGQAGDQAVDTHVETEHSNGDNHNACVGENHVRAATGGMVGAASTPTEREK